MAERDGAKTLQRLSVYRFLGEALYSWLSRRESEPGFQEFDCYWCNSQTIL
jgi:hypothetical protein